MRRPTRTFAAPRIAAAVLLALVPAAGGSQSLSGFGETIEVRRIDVDVLVTDESGVPVVGLPREEFELYEDGKQVEIREFSEFRGRVPAAAYDATPPDAGEPVPRSLAMTWVVYMDSSKPAPGPRNDAMKQLNRFLEGSTRPEDRFLLATADGRQLRIAADLGNDPRKLGAAFDDAIRAAGSGMSRQSSAGQLLLLVQDVVSNSGVGAAVPGDAGRRPVSDAVEDAFWAQLDSYLTDEEIYARAALRNLDDLFGIVSGIPGRVAVLLVGGDLDLRPGESMLNRLRSRLDRVPSALMRLNQVGNRYHDLDSEYRKLLERANASRVTLYTIDATSGDEFGRTPVEEATLPDFSGPMRAATPGAAVGLGELARATGGRPYTASPQLAERLAEVAYDLSNYYSLSYEPQGERAAGYRKIEVRMKRPGLRVRHRDGVRERPPGEKSSDTAVAALLGGELDNPLNVRAVLESIAPGSPQAAEKASAKPRKSRKSTGQSIRIEVPLWNLLMVPDAAILRGKLLFHFAMLDERQTFHRLEERDLDFSVPQDRLAEALEQHVSYVFELPLSPGRWRVAAVVTDAVAGVESVVVLPISVSKK